MDSYTGQFLIGVTAITAGVYLFGWIERLLKKREAPHVAFAWYATIKYSFYYLVWTYLSSVFLPILIAGLLAFWGVVSQFISVRNPEPLSWLQPKVIWLYPKPRQAPDDPPTPRHQPQEDP